MAKRTTHRGVDPCHPVAPYVGGKHNLARRLVERIDATPHTLYAEVFVGMAGVFLRRRQAPKSEVINDLQLDVATLFRILQRHYVPFLEMMRFQLTTRAEFERLTATDPATLTDLERAARFLYLQRTAFGGKVTGRNFGVAPDRAGRFDITTLAPLLEAVHERLAGVVIERLDFREFIPRYDRPSALFYLDPPYWGSEAYYGRDLFKRADFAELAGILRGLKGRFILSVNDTPEVREIFAGFDIEAAATSYSIAEKGSAVAAELIITGP